VFERVYDMPEWTIFKPFDQSAVEPGDVET
jgi:hypothetical protein